MVRIRELRKEFFSLRGRTVALDGVNLDVASGTFYVLLGPSGCGKTTLLNIIAGIEKPSHGEVWIGDKPVVSTETKTFVPPRGRNIAMVFQSYALYPHMSVFDNIAFPLRIAKTEKAEIRRAVQGVAETLEISHLLRARPAELSGGQRQRVAIGRAIVRKPTVLLLDEPLSNLDAQLRVAMRRELKELQRRMNVTTVYVTHDQMEAMTLGDKIAVMRDGQIEQVGAPDDVYDRPESTFVAKFVGTPPMNLIDGKTLEASGTELLMFKTLISKSLDPKATVFGIRPEKLRVCGDAGTHKGESTAGEGGAFDLASAAGGREGSREVEASGVLYGQVTMVGSLGMEKLLYVKLADHEVLAKCPAAGSVSEGEHVALGFDEKDLLTFNKTDGRRVEL